MEFYYSAYTLYLTNKKELNYFCNPKYLSLRESNKNNHGVNQKQRTHTTNDRYNQINFIHISIKTPVGYKIVVIVYYQKKEKQETGRDFWNIRFVERQWYFSI